MNSRKIFKKFESDHQDLKEKYELICEKLKWVCWRKYLNLMINIAIQHYEDNNLEVDEQRIIDDVIYFVTENLKDTFISNELNKIYISYL